MEVFLARADSVMIEVGFRDGRISGFKVVLFKEVLESKVSIFERIFGLPQLLLRRGWRVIG